MGLLVATLSWTIGAGVAAAVDPTVSPSLTEIVVGGRSNVKVVFDHSDPGTYYYQVHWNDDGWSTVASLVEPSGTGIAIRVTSGAIGSNEVGMIGAEACEPGDPQSCTGSDIAGPVGISLPYSLSASPLAGQAKLDWSYYQPPGSNLVGFDLFVRTSGQSWPTSPTATVGAEARTYTFAGLGGGQSYDVGVRAVQQSLNPTIHTGIASRSVTPTGAAGQTWDPHRARDEAGAVFPFVARTNPPEQPGTIYVNNGGSLRDAIGSANANDVIVVRDGVYREALGQINEKVTIRAEVGAHPKILGTERVGVNSFTTYAGSTAGVRRAQIWNSNPLRSVGSGLDESAAHYLGLVDGGNPADLLPEQVYRVDSNTGAWVELTQVRWDGGVNNWPHQWDNLQANGTFSYSPNSKNFYLKLSSSDWANTSHLEIARHQEAIRFNANADGSLLAGLEFRGFSPPTDSETFGVVTAGGSAQNPIDGFELRDIKITDSSYAGIKLNRVNSATLTRVTSSGNVGPGLNSNRLHGLDIEFSDFTDNSRPTLDDRRSVLAGVKIAGDTAGDRAVTVRYSRFVGNGGTGLWCDLWCQNTLVVGNYVAGNAKHGVYYEVSENATIASNLFVESGTSGVKVSGSQNVDIVRNTFAGAADHLRITSDTDTRASDGYRRPGDPNNIVDTSDVDIEGNLFVEPAGSQTHIINPVNWTAGDAEHNRPSARINTYDRNAIAINTGNPGDYRYRWDNGGTAQTPRSFTALSNKGGSDQTWRTDNPYLAFRNAGSGDYRIATGIAALQGISQAIPTAATDVMIGPSGAGPAGAVFF